MAMKGHPLTKDELAIRNKQPLLPRPKPLGRVLFCHDCGENGTKAGGLHKDGDDYKCNIPSICGRVKREKAILMGQRKAK